MRKQWIAVMFVVLSGLGARQVQAEGAVLFVGGVNIGGNLNVLTDGNLDLQTALKNSPLFGLRVGSYGFPFGIEGSVAYTPSGLVGGAFDGAIDSNTSILYTEANVLLILLPGPVAPFVTVGGGLHYLDFDVSNLFNASSSKFGWNIGGGLKIEAERLALRVDIRDHVTTVGFGDLGLNSLGPLFGLSSSEARVHNVELSIGIGIRF